MDIGRFTTHVLDTAHGRPAAGMRVELWKDETLVLATPTNPEGGCDSPLPRKSPDL